MLIETHHALLDCPEYTRVAPQISLGHLRGDANLASDAVSRFEAKVLARLARNLRTRLIEIPRHPSCDQILQRVLQYAVQRNQPVRPNPYQSTPTLIPPALLQHVAPSSQSPAKRLHAKSAQESGLGKERRDCVDGDGPGRFDCIDGDGPRSSSPHPPSYSSCPANLPCELFGLGRCPSCADYDGPPSGTSLQLRVSSAELGNLFRAAERAVVKHSEGIASSESQLPSVDTSRACIRLLRALGIASVKLSSQLALMAALDKLHRPSKFDTDKQYWEAYGASRSNFLVYVRVLREAMASLLPTVELVDLVPSSWGQGGLDVAQIGDHPAVLMLQSDPQLPLEVFGLGRCPSCCDYDGPGAYAAARREQNAGSTRACSTSNKLQPSATGRTSRLYQATRPQTATSSRPAAASSLPSTPAPPPTDPRMQITVVGGQRFAAPGVRKARATSTRKTAMLALAHERAVAMASATATEQQKANLAEAVVATHELAEFGAAYTTLDKMITLGNTTSDSAASTDLSQPSALNSPPAAQIKCASA